MQHYLRPITVLLSLLLLSWQTYAVTQKSYEEIEWVALMPDEDLAALMDPPDYLSNVQDGSNQDSMQAFNNTNFEDEKVKRFKQALNSQTTIPAFNNKNIRLPGFIVPLQQREDHLVTEFFIVPYFGACIHMPPPPPNQIIHVNYEKGVELESIQQPFWFEGTVSIETQQRELGTSAYTL